MTYIPELIMLVGLAGSGKSTYASTLGNDFIIHSSDDLRKEMFGDENENSKESNAKLFIELHKRIKTDLINGNNVVYDATNLNRKRRISFLNELVNIPCKKSCMLIMSPYHVCLRNNKCRDRTVPEEVIKRMYMNFQPPIINEGWDSIDIIFSCNVREFKDYNIGTLFNKATGIDYFNQCNSHHSFTLGEHSKKAARYIQDHCPKNYILCLTALLHDEGKVFTKTNINAKGYNDGNCHYYQHNCVGAYNSIFYTYNLKYSLEDVLHVATLIYYHMHPYTVWKNSEKAKDKDIKLLGTDLFNEIMILNKADEYAH